MAHTHMGTKIPIEAMELFQSVVNVPTLLDDIWLDILLRGLGVETLIITGAWTNMSIEHTARHAADAGSRAVVASDGTSTVDDEWQNAALSYAMQNVAVVAGCSEITEALGT